MTPTVDLQAIEDVPADAHVRDYDELAPPTQDQLVALVDNETAGVTDDAAAAFESYDVVKFTDYYCISVHHDSC